MISGVCLPMFFVGVGQSFSSFICWAFHELERSAWCWAQILFSKPKWATSDAHESIQPARFRASWFGIYLNSALGVNSLFLRFQMDNVPYCFEHIIPVQCQVSIGSWQINLANFSNFKIAKFEGLDFYMQGLCALPHLQWTPQTEWSRELDVYESVPHNSYSSSTWESFLWPVVFLLDFSLPWDYLLRMIATRFGD